jgi:hypothetical protein
MYITLTSYNHISSLNYDSVASFDLNLNAANATFMDLVSSLNLANDEGIQQIKRMFFASAGQIVLMQSDGNVYENEPVLDFIVPDIPGDQARTDYLREQFWLTNNATLLSLDET